MFVDLEIPLIGDSDEEETEGEVTDEAAALENKENAANSAGSDARASKGSGAGASRPAEGDGGGAGGGGARLPALRLVLSAGGASLPLERPSWTVYRAVLALNQRLPHTDTHRDTTYTLTYKEIEGMETFASSSDSEDDEPSDPGESRHKINNNNNQICYSVTRKWLNRFGCNLVWR